MLQVVWRHSDSPKAAICWSGWFAGKKGLPIERGFTPERREWQLRHASSECGSLWKGSQYRSHGWIRPAQASECWSDAGLSLTPRQDPWNLMISAVIVSSKLSPWPVWVSACRWRACYETLTRSQKYCRIPALSRFSMYCAEYVQVLFIYTYDVASSHNSSHEKILTSVSCGAVYEPGSLTSSYLIIILQYHAGQNVQNTLHSTFYTWPKSSRSSLFCMTSINLFLQGSKLYHNVLTAAQQQMLENLPASAPQDQGLGPPFRPASNLERSSTAERNHLGNEAGWLGRNLPPAEVMSWTTPYSKCSCHKKGHDTHRR